MTIRKAYKTSNRCFIGIFLIMASLNGCAYLFLGGISVLLSFENADGAYSAAKETEIRNETVYSNSYDALSRPETQTHIRVGLSILAIDELSLKDQKFSATGWFTFEWDDARLMWNKSAKDDIEYIFAKPASVWVPELVVDNSLVSLELVDDPDILLRIKYDGVVDWEIPRLFEVHCEADIVFYPYDRQKCTVELSSWVYRLDELKLDHLFTEIDLEDFQLNGEWEVLKTYVEDKNLTETLHGITHYYPQLDFWFSLRRRTDFYNLNVMMPVFLTSILIGLVFVVPVESGEKLSYVLTVYLSLAVLMTIINDSLPSTSISTSVLGLYLAIVLVLSAIGILFTVIILIMFHFEGKLEPTSKATAFLLRAAKVTRQKLPRETEITCLTKVQPVDADDNLNDKKPEKTTVYVFLTWREAAIILDWFCFVVFGIFTLCMNISFVIALTVGGYVQEE